MYVYTILAAAERHGDAEGGVGGCGARFGSWGEKGASSTCLLTGTAG